MDSLIVKPSTYINIVFTPSRKHPSQTQCWGCNGSRGDKWIYLTSEQSIITPYICMGCYNYNKENLLQKCVNCSGNFLIDYTKLKPGDNIKYGFDEFRFCYNCLLSKINKTIDITIVEYSRSAKLSLDFYDMDDPDYDKYEDEYYEKNDYLYMQKFNNSNDKIIRIIGQSINNEEKI